ncbi:uncharacterized protein K452DRAFT_310595 [Aplosporella prunicola CBS 121167]|uniref:Uncharacterized protein n=1 Tax=Aplosporella prunicola CBS 121167 TaxID=1176127 RepID=A0A6A6B802_9PEZI|nr:uncharacterized protein K452DRAFT_310595 [Aplosporella prunicola CBS 121167]KAF2139688.1 hypothetical protein K452DRAFT_310595 [Aplosporella prunicola CBS 121167]
MPVDISLISLEVLAVLPPLNDHINKIIEQTPPSEVPTSRLDAQIQHELQLGDKDDRGEIVRYIAHELAIHIKELREEKHHRLDFQRLMKLYEQQQEQQQEQKQQKWRKLLKPLKLLKRQKTQHQSDTQLDAQPEFPYTRPAPTCACGQCPDGGCDFSLVNKDEYGPCKDCECVNKAWRG